MDPDSLRHLFPAEARVAVSTGAAAARPLHPDEEKIVERAVESRRREFARGRDCAHRALADLGVTTASLLSADDRAPQWPEGVVGSITHCRGFTGAVVARASDVGGLGFDAERATPLERKLWRMVCTPEEAAWIDATPAPPLGEWGKILFSAKESVHKCIYPATGVWLGFRDVRVSFSPDERTFVPTLQLAEGDVEIDGDRVAALLREMSGRYAVTDALVMTATALPPPVHPAPLPTDPGSPPDSTP